jgi:hypothetical protein
MRLASWLAWLLPVAALGPLALAHCSSGNSSTGTPDSGKVGSGSSGGGIGSSTGSSGSSSGGSMVMEPTDAGPTPVVDATSPSGEGGADGSQGPPATPVPEGGAPSDPGSVVCNGAPCDVSSGSTCCYVRTDGGSTETCNAPNTGCSTSLIACNEAADCKGGVCCQTIIGIGLQGSTFCTAASADSCPGASTMYPQGTFQTCRTDDECGKNSDAGALKRCIPQQCTAPGTANPASVMVEACATPLGPGNDAGTLGFCKRL